MPPSLNQPLYVTKYWPNLYQRWIISLRRIIHESQTDKSTTVDINPVFRWILAPNFSSLDLSTSMSCRRTHKRGEFGAKIRLNSGFTASSLNSSASSSYRCAAWWDEFGAKICLNTGLICKWFYPSQTDNYLS